MRKTMFERSEAARAAADRLWEHATGLGRGDVIPHDLLERIVGSQRPEPIWRAATAEFRRRMLSDRGIAVSGIFTPGAGLRLLTVREQIEWLPRHRHIKARRQYRRIEREVTEIDPDDMTGYQRCLAAAQAESARAMRRAIQADARTRAVLFTPAAGHPRPEAVRH